MIDVTNMTVAQVRDAAHQEKKTLGCYYCDTQLTTSQIAAGNWKGDAYGYSGVCESCWQKIAVPQWAAETWVGAGRLPARKKVLAETATIAEPKVTRKVDGKYQKLSREQRAQQLVDAGRVRFIVAPGIYAVQASDFQNWYRVDAVGEGDCQCADHQRGGAGWECKHVQAAKLDAVKRVLHEARVNGTHCWQPAGDYELACACRDWAEEYGCEFTTELSAIYRETYRAALRKETERREQQVVREF